MRGFCQTSLLFRMILSVVFELMNILSRSRQPCFRLRIGGGFLPHGKLSGTFYRCVPQIGFGARIFFVLVFLHRAPSRNPISKTGCPKMPFWMSLSQIDPQSATHNVGRLENIIVVYLKSGWARLVFVCWFPFIPFQSQVVVYLKLSARPPSGGKSRKPKVKLDVPK